MFNFTGADNIDEDQKYEQDLLLLQQYKIYPLGEEWNLMLFRCSSIFFQLLCIFRSIKLVITYAIYSKLWKTKSLMLKMNVGNLNLEKCVITVKTCINKGCCYFAACCMFSQVAQMDGSGSCQPDWQVSWHLSDVLSYMIPALLCRYLHRVQRGSCILCHYSQGYMRLSLRWQEQASSFFRRAVGTIRELRALRRGLCGQPFSFPFHFRHLILIVCAGWSSGSWEWIDFAGVPAAQCWHIYFCIILMRPIDEGIKHALQLIMGGSKVGHITSHNRGHFYPFSENKAHSEGKCMHSF